MPELYYKEANKLAQKEYRACIAGGHYPCLPVLDDFIPEERSAAGTDAGLQQIPAEFIVGTKTRGRTNSFARNYMPLMAEGSEFALKWEMLCQAHLTEGIREPIKVYEYMNRYYVEEGNKRVSVLKFFDAVSIPAQVRRVLPLHNGEVENERYYAYLAFYQCSNVNYLEFSQKSSYPMLQSLLGKEPQQAWTKEEQQHFKSAYYTFRKVYDAKGGTRLEATPGDALLAFIKVYGYPTLCNSSEAQLKKLMAKMWEEMELQQETPAIELMSAPGEEKKPGLLSKVLPGANKAKKVAFLHDKNPEQSGWTFGHELGRAHVERVFAGKIATSAYFDVMERDPYAVIEQAIEEGNTVLFTTSPRLLPASLRAAVEHPEVTILNCAVNKPHRYVRSYYARMYEAKFITGAIAGAMTADGRVGYVCDYPIFGQIAGINAFALGAQMVNPRVKVHLEWSSVGGNAAAHQRLLEQGITLISSQDLAKLKGGRYNSFGLTDLSGKEPQLLAMPQWQWGVYYEEMLRLILSKTIQSEYENSSKALNYYWGMSAGVIDLYCSDRVPESVRKLARYLKEGICRETCNPFYGVLTFQSGKTLGREEESLVLEDIIAMDELAENVVGTIPVYEELNPMGKATVEIAGVEPAAKHTTAQKKGAEQ